MPPRRIRWGQAFAVQRVAHLVATTPSCLQPGPVTWDKTLGELCVEPQVGRPSVTGEANNTRLPDVPTVVGVALLARGLGY